MIAGLREINELAGAWGSLIIDNRGEIIASVSPPGAKKDALANITNHILELLESAGESITGLTEAVIHYSQWTLFIQDLEQAILVVISTPTVDISLLRMTTNVVVTNWQVDPKIQKQLKDNYVERI